MLLKNTLLCGFFFWYTFFRFIKMQASVHIEGKEHEFNIKLPTTAIRLKQLIAKECGIPVQVQHLYYFPEIPVHMAPQLDEFADDQTFQEHVLNKQVSCVLTFGYFSSWAYFYVHFQPGCAEKAVFRFNSHRLQLIVDVKKDICLETRIPVSKMSLLINGEVLTDNLSLFQLGIQNGTNLSCLLG